MFTTPVHNEEDDVNVTNIIPKVRGLNKERACAAVSIGAKCYRSERLSWPNDSPIESGLCVKTMLSADTLRFGKRQVSVVPREVGSAGT